MNTVPKSDPVEVDGSVQIRVTEAARKTAKIRAAFEGLSLEEWVSRAIAAQADREESRR